MNLDFSRSSKVLYTNVASFCIIIFFKPLTPKESKRKIGFFGCKSKILRQCVPGLSNLSVLKVKNGHFKLSLFIILWKFTNAFVILFDGKTLVILILRLTLLLLFAVLFISVSEISTISLDIIVAVIYLFIIYNFIYN